MGTDSELSETDDTEGSWLISGLFFTAAFAWLLAVYNLFLLVPAMTSRTAYLGPGPQFMFHIREIILWAVVGAAVFGLARWMAAQEGLLE